MIKVIDKSFNFSLFILFTKSSEDLVMASRFIQIFWKHLRNMWNVYESQFKNIENETTELSWKRYMNTEYQQC